MEVRLRNALTGRVEELSPAAAPLLRLRVWSSGDASTLAGWRLGHFYAAAAAALDHLGFQVRPVEDPRAEVDVHAGLREPAGPAGCWLKPDPRAAAPETDVERLTSGGLGPLALALACLRARYDEPLALTQAQLESARHEAMRLAALSNHLRAAAGGSAPNAKALAGYRKRLRDALARDLDLPSACACLWDALRPGALSPGSQLAFLKEAGWLLGLHGL